MSGDEISDAVRKLGKVIRESKGHWFPTGEDKCAKCGVVRDQASQVPCKPVYIKEGN